MRKRNKIFFFTVCYNPLHMSRPFEAVERAGERKPSYFERGLFRARNLDELAKEFLDPSADPERVRLVQEVFNRVIGSKKEFTPSEEAAVIVELIEALDSEGLVPVQFFHGKERTFSTMETVFPFEKMLLVDPPYEIPSETRIHHYLSIGRSQTPGTVKELFSVAVLWNEMLRVEKQIQEANQCIRRIQELESSIIGERIPPSPSLMAPQMIPEWSLADQSKGKEVDRKDWDISKDEALANHLVVSFSRPIDPGAFLDFYFPFPSKPYYADETSHYTRMNSQPITQSLAELVLPALEGKMEQFFGEYQFVIGWFFYFQGMLDKGIKGQDRDSDYSEAWEELLLYHQLFSALKDIIESGFIPLKLGVRPKILMLSNAPAWRERLVNSIQDKKVLSVNLTPGMSARDASAQMDAIGLRAPTVEELEQLFYRRSR